MKEETGNKEPQQYSVRKSILFWIMLFLLVITYSLLIPEIILRFRYREEEINGNYWGIGAFEYSELLGYRHAPEFEGYAVRPGVFITPVQINHIGLRQANFEDQMQYPTRLLILGDSFAFGLGVKEESAFVSLMQAELNLENIGVLNGGQTGYSGEQEVRFGISLVPDLKPDIIILNLYPGNDIAGDFIKGYRNTDVEYGYRLPKDRWLPLQGIDYLRTHSYLWMLLENRINRTKPDPKYKRFNKLSESKPEKVIQPSLDAVRELHDFCEQNNIWFGIMMIPPRSGSTIFDDKLRMALGEYDIDVLDLGIKNYNEKDYIVGDGHWNENGHQKAAQYLVPFVRQLINK